MTQHENYSTLTKKFIGKIGMANIKISYIFLALVCNTVYAIRYVINTFSSVWGVISPVIIKINDKFIEKQETKIGIRTFGTPFI